MLTLDPDDPTAATARQRSRWLRWAYVGVDYAHSMSQARKIVQVNVGVMVLMATIYGLAALYLATFAFDAVRPTLWQIPVVSAGPLVWWLNARKHFNAARWTALWLAVVTVLVAIVMGQGSVMSAHYYFALIALVTPTIFEYRQWRSMVFMSTVCVALFGYFSLVGIAPSPAVAAIPKDIQVMAQGTVVALGVVIMMLLVGLTEASSAEAEARLTLLAHTDTLTGLANRRAFEQRFHRDRQLSLRNRSALFVVLLDIDHFKAINDQYGHEAGDDALRHVAQVLRANIRPYDEVARLGGEEFAWLLPSTNAQTALQSAERVRERLAASEWLVAGQRHPITASFGVADGTHADSAASALAWADTALYAAKSGGRNQVQLAQAPAVAP